MRQQKTSRSIPFLISTCSIFLLCFSQVHAAARTVVIHAFNGGLEGGSPQGPLVADKLGNLYGSNSSGGSGYGTIFELSPPSTPGGGWTETTLYTFSGSTDGAYPNGGLAIDSEGVLYGTTLQGGACLSGYCGVVFQLSPPFPGTTLVFSVLYTFPVNQGSPTGNLALDAQGNLYGAAQAGGTQPFGAGYIFQLTRPSAPFQPWTESNILNFSGYPIDGALPNNVIVDAQGIVFGTTNQGGAGRCFDAGTFIGCGTAYSLVKQSSGKWVETIIHNFSASEENSPAFGLTFGLGHALYGTAGYTVYRLQPPPDPTASWTKSVIHTFPEGINGTEPFSILTVDASGNLYGTSSPSGIEGFGTAYELSPTSATLWTETNLAVFPGYTNPQPNGGVIRNASGVLFGVADSSLPTQAGFAFAIVP